MSKTAGTRFLIDNRTPVVRHLRIEVRKGPDKGQSAGVEAEPVRIGTSEGIVCTGSRIYGKYNCSWRPGNEYCTPISDYPTEMENADPHGTQVASVLLGDYTHHQGNGLALGDTDWITTACTQPNDCYINFCSGGLCVYQGWCFDRRQCGTNMDCIAHRCQHSPAWENAASGMARDAGLVFFGPMDTWFGPNSYANAVAVAISLHVDVINSSMGVGEAWGNHGDCNLVSNNIGEAALEDAFDDGVFVVQGAGSLDGATLDHCSILYGADTPKVFAVNAFDSTNSDCGVAGYYTRSCLVAQHDSAQGGGDAVIGGVNYSRAVTMIGALAPTDITRTTKPNEGPVSDDFGGTSAATPHVAGLALLVKDFYLLNSQTWINQPGRLHTIMLGMTDRAYSTDPDDLYVDAVQRNVGGDRIYGFGHIKLRQPWRYVNGERVSMIYSHITTTSFTPSSGYATHFIQPTPSGTSPATVMVKCVLFAYEDMTQKTDISDIDLTVTVRDPVAGACSGSGTSRFSRSDSSRDIKSMVAIEDSDTDLNNKCFQVYLYPWHVSSSGVTTSDFCYFSPVDDDSNL